MKNDSLSQDCYDANLAGPGSPMTHEEWLGTFWKLKKLSDEIKEIFRETARSIAKDAGLEPKLLDITPYNEMCRKNNGEPSPDVDYNRVQVVLDLLAHQYDSHRAIDAFDQAVRLEPRRRWLEANPRVMAVVNRHSSKG